MEVLYPRCCGLDVHKKTVVACAITPEGKEIHTFKTMTSDLLELADWIDAKKRRIPAVSSVLNPQMIGAPPPGGLHSTVNPGASTSA